MNTRVHEFSLESDFPGKVLAPAFIGLGMLYWFGAQGQIVNKIFAFAFLQFAYALSIWLSHKLPELQRECAILAFSTFGLALAVFWQNYVVQDEYWLFLSVWAFFAIPTCLVVRDDLAWCGWLLVVCGAIWLRLDIRREIEWHVCLVGWCIALAIWLVTRFAKAQQLGIGPLSRWTSLLLLLWLIMAGALPSDSGQLPVQYFIAVGILACIFIAELGGWQTQKWLRSITVFATAEVTFTLGAYWSLQSGFLAYLDGWMYVGPVAIAVSLSTAILGRYAHKLSRLCAWRIMYVGIVFAVGSFALPLMSLLSVFHSREFPLIASAGLAVVSVAFLNKVHPSSKLSLLAVGGLLQAVALSAFTLAISGHHHWELWLAGPILFASLLIKVRSIRLLLGFLFGVFVFYGIGINRDWDLWLGRIAMYFAATYVCFAAWLCLLLVARVVPRFRGTCLREFAVGLAVAILFFSAICGGIRLLGEQPFHSSFETIFNDVISIHREGEVLKISWAGYVSLAAFIGTILHCLVVNPDSRRPSTFVVGVSLGSIAYLLPWSGLAFAILYFYSLEKNAVMVSLSSVVLLWLSFAIREDADQTFREVSLAMILAGIAVCAVKTYVKRDSQSALAQTERQSFGVFVLIGLTLIFFTIAVIVGELSIAKGRLLRIPVQVIALQSDIRGNSLVLKADVPLLDEGYEFSDLPMGTLPLAMTVDESGNAGPSRLMKNKPIQNGEIFVRAVRERFGVSLSGFRWYICAPDLEEYLRAELTGVFKVTPDGTTRIVALEK